MSKYNGKDQKMTTCHDMKLNEIYVCEDCGLELKVVRECRDVGQDKDECCGSSETCSLLCCGKELVKK
jgi:hypothetical protein